MENAIDMGPCIVLINEEEQYSLWPKRRTIPAGWRAVGFEGTKEQCSAHVDSLWTDMRPRSLRVAMERSAALISDSDRAATANGIGGSQRIVNADPA